MTTVNRMNQPGNPTLASRPRTYLLARNDAIDPQSAGPLDFDWVIEQLDRDPQVEVLSSLRPRTFFLQSTGPSPLQNVVVASIPAPTVAELEKHPQVVIEEDHFLTPVLSEAEADALPGGPPPLVSLFGTSTSWQLQLKGTDGSPVVGATVYLYGQGMPAQGQTDQSGMVTLSLLNESDATLRALYVNPKAGYWSIWVNRPALTSGIVNQIPVRSLAETFPGFPQAQLTGWGQTAMRLNQVPRTFDGRGIKVAVVDSGAAADTHRDLHAVHAGVDLTGAGSADAWKVDTIAHGSHCTGIIAGAANGVGIRGFAPAAVVHEVRIFPGGRVSSLLDAIDYCIDNQVDVVNMSLGSGGTSQLMLAKLAQARQQGVACIVAAGNSGNAVQFPGSSPDVLTVAAIGMDGQFPDDSYHAQQRWAAGQVDKGYFAAQFSCHGPEVGVCGPGVAIVSSVPDDGFAAWDGTSMATPHIAGLAALVLAHHPDFQQPGLALRTAARVDRLFEILKASATPLSFGDPQRSGAGLPDAPRALALVGGTAEADPITQGAAIAAALATLRAELVAAGLLELDPQSAGPTRLALNMTSEQAIRSELATLNAQMVAAGIA